MNNAVVLNKIKNIIETNKDTLVTGLEHQMQARQIHQITTSTLTPPMAFYAILISIPEAVSDDKMTAANTRNVPRKANYTVSITVADEAVMSLEENELFEVMDQDFQKFVNRIAKLIVDSDKNRQIVLVNNREVYQRNETDGFIEAEMFHAMLYSEIRFTILEYCEDDELY